MEFTIRIDMDLIREDGRERELARILEDVAQQVRDGDTSDICVEQRGATVGGWQIND